MGNQDAHNCNCNRRMDLPLKKEYLKIKKTPLQTTIFTPNPKNPPSTPTFHK